MSTRRAHTKSRRGCKRCKGRRMKCDEVHPKCGSCSKSGALCDYGLLSNVVSTKSLLQTTTTALMHSGSVSSMDSDVALSRSSSPSPVPTELALNNFVTYLKNQRDVPTLYGNMSTPSDRILDEKLFHHYVDMSRRVHDSSASSDTIAIVDTEHPTKDARLVWFNWIVRLATQNSNVMDALLALSAFHLRRLTNSDKTLTEAAHRYMLRAIAEHSKQVSQGITAENAETIFATGTFIAFHVTSESINPLNNDGKFLMHWFQPWDSIRSVLDLCWEHIKSPEIQALVKYEQGVTLLIQTGEDPAKFNFLLEDLGDTTDPYLDEESRNAYTVSVHYLNMLSTPPLAKHVLKFTGLVPKRFVELVLAKDPRAMAITGYHLMMIRTHNHIWWLHASAERDFKIVLENLPASWLPKMELAIRTLQGHKL